MNSVADESGTQNLLKCRTKLIMGEVAPQRVQVETETWSGSSLSLIVPLRNTSVSSFIDHYSLSRPKIALSLLREQFIHKTFFLSRFVVKAFKTAESSYSEAKNFCSCRNEVFNQKLPRNPDSSTRASFTCNMKCVSSPDAPHPSDQNVQPKDISSHLLTIAANGV